MTAKFLAAAAAQGKTTGDINASRCIAKQFGTVSGGSTTAPSFNTPNGSWAALSMTASGSNFAFVWYACG